MSASRGRILVIRGGAIGDFILTLPAISALRRHFPQAHLEVLGYPHIAQLALAGGLVDRVQPIEARGLAGFFARDGHLAEPLRDYFSEFDVVVSYLYDPDEVFQTNVALCTAAQFIAAPHRPDEKQLVHATKVYLKPLERLAIFDADEVPRLSVQAPRSPQPLLAFHPGSGSERKNWLVANWAGLLAQLAGFLDLKFLLVGGEAEGQRLDELVRSLPVARCELARSLPLAELAMRLHSCQAFVGHDSGITHLAAALNVPTLVLWADTVEEVWRPQGGSVSLIRDAAGIHAIQVELVVNRLKQLLRLASDPPA